MTTRSIEGDGKKDGEVEKAIKIVKIKKSGSSGLKYNGKRAGRLILRSSYKDNWSDNIRILHRMTDI